MQIGWGVAGESFHQTSLYHNTLSRFSSRRQVTDRQTLTRGQNHPKPHVYHAISHCVLVNCLCCFTSSVQNIRHKSRTDSDGDQLSSHHVCTNCSAILFLACQTFVKSNLESYYDKNKILLSCQTNFNNPLLFPFLESVTRVRFHRLCLKPSK